MKTRITLPAAVSRPALCWLLIFHLALLGAAAAHPGLHISEFMAADGGRMLDADGERPDWVELYNASAVTMDLAGWHLTDDAAILNKWTFPATNLPAGGRLVVFASGKNRAVAGAELHTNFELSRDGEYLALVKPDGTTIAHHFTPAFPRQRDNVSCGVVMETVVTPLIATGATARVLVPADGTLGASWTARIFNDAAWLTTPTPIGFAVSTVATPLLALDFNRRGENAAATTHAGFTPFLINSNLSSSAIQTQATVRVFGAISLTISNTAPYGYDDRWRAAPLNNGDFTESLLLRDFVFSRAQTGTGGLDFWIAGLAAHRAHRFTVWSFDGSISSLRVSDWWANGLLVTNGYAFLGANVPTSNDQYRFQFESVSDASGRVLISGRRNASSTSHAVFLNALRIEKLEAEIPTNSFASLMLGHNASAYLRIPFTVADPNAFPVLRLRIKYDDGFVAYINGQFVAARNAPVSPPWNAAATTARADPESQVFEEIIFTNSPGLLVNGANVLAIHGLNSSANDPDFWVLPELEGVNPTALVNRYFMPPTPGAENGAGYLGLVADTKFSADRGFYETPFTVAITSATVNASIYWTANGSAPSPTNGTLYTAPIPVTGTTLLRAAAFLADHVPTGPDAQTYLFLNQVLQQPNNPSGYPTNWQASYPADYEMDPNVVNHPNYGATLINDLRAIPTLSMVTDHDALWHPTTGIYVDATKRGDAYERAASVELFRGDNQSEFQVTCGIQMQGNASRDNNRLAKHSFRLMFRSEYGPSKLIHDWFPGPVNRFDNVILRACFSDAWPTRYSDQTLIPGGKGTRYRPENSLYLRDVWVKDSLRDMGHLTGQGDFVHLYLNGLYWGVYNATERMDDSFCAQHLGGYRADWDVMAGDAAYNVATLMDGSRRDWDQLTALVNAGITSEVAYQAIAERVDLENLADYMLLHIFAEAEDWPHHNWYAAHRRANPANGLPATKWIFLPWDQEIVLDQLVRRNQVNVMNTNTPARIYSQLRAWPEFRRLFGDRVQKHLFNNGALTPSNNIARLHARAHRIDRAIVGESARWGDAREFTIGSNPGHGQTFTRDEWWAAELQKLYTNFFPTLTATNVSRFRAVNLYPVLDAPQFNQFGGAVPSGFGLVMSHARTAPIYYTLDGSDPRTYGTAEVAPAAQAYEFPVPINSPTFVRARARLGTVWSALVEAVFTPPQDLGKLVVTEVMYNPPAFGVFAGNDLEFLELKNVGTNALNLSGLSFSAGIAFSFPDGTLFAPGEFCVLVRNPTAFVARYPGVPIRGVYSGQLDNGGETITLSHPGGGRVFSLSYDDAPPWPVTPDGHGFSLVPRQPGLTQAPDQGRKWRASAWPGGSPGADDPEPGIPPIVISEILTHTDPPQTDAIELFNPTGTNVDVGGWSLTDSAGAPRHYRIPPGSIVPAGGCLYFDESHFNSGTDGNVPFALSSTGEEVYLFSADADGQLTGYNHGVVFGAAFTGVSFGRYVNSTGEEFFPPQRAVTLGGANAGPRIGPIVLNEIHYHPAAGDVEFVELLNQSDDPVALFHATCPTNTWKLNGLAFTFPANLTLGPSELLLVVATNPAAFRAQYDVPTGVRVLGPFPGVLQNSGERLALEAPDTPNPGMVPYVAVEEVRYSDRAPWPPGADGGGLSLQRRSAFGFGNEPVNWVAAAPTPGRFSMDSDSDGDGLPDAWEIEHGLNWKQPDADDDPDGDGMTNGEEFLAGTNPNDPFSGLLLDAFTYTPEEIALQFLAVSNRTYSVLVSESVEWPDWEKLVNIPAESTNRIVTVTAPVSGLRSRFYRLATPQWP